MSYDDKRAWRGWYGLARWQRMRHAQLSAQPICIICIQSETVTIADTVDHVRRHNGDERLFWDTNNLQSLCKSCHDTVKAREERGLHALGVEADGWPVWRK